MSSDWSRKIASKISSVEDDLLTLIEMVQESHKEAAIEHLDEAVDSFERFKNELKSSDYRQQDEGESSQVQPLQTRPDYGEEDGTANVPPSPHEMAETATKTARHVHKIRQTMTPDKHAKFEQIMSSHMAKKASYLTGSEALRKMSEQERSDLIYKLERLVPDRHGV